jgi:3-phenylpropionate/trans-cinnamate dioxygenase ferredoxin reductase subunit
MEDSDALKGAFAPDAGRVVIIGGGWIGLEVAAAARTLGLDVTVLEMAELPLLRVLGPEMAQVFADLHREHGVDLRCGVRVERLLSDRAGRVMGVELDSGEVVRTGTVVVGVGIRPNTALAELAGLEVSNGVVVDEHLRTAHPAIFAAGDVANAYHPFLGRHLRVEHWANALRQGPVAARSMLGQDATYERLPYFFTDQYDLGMEYNGYAEPDGYDRVVVRGDVGAREFVAFWLDSGRVVAGMGVNIWDTSKPVTALITSRREVDVARLADPDVPLEDV